MRTISRSTRFKRDYKRESKGQHKTTLDADLRAALEFLVRDLPAPATFRDHALTGNWKDHRDLHLRPDLILIYRLPSAELVDLVRMGSHSELGL